MSDRKNAYLVYQLGEEPEQIVLWDTIDVSVGRHRGQDIMVPDTEVSREHALLRREGGKHFVKDQTTGLGTWVNGQRIRVHELAHGDEIRVGPLRLKFGVTAKALRAGGNTRFASELKAGVLPGASTEGNRTMLGFKPEVDEVAVEAVPTRPSGPRALSADGDLEDLGVSQPDLGSMADFDELMRGEAPPPRNLDEELAAEGMGLPDDTGADTAEPAVAVEETSQSATQPSPGRRAASAELRVELEGPPEALKALADALIDREIRIGGVEVRVRRRRG